MVEAANSLQFELSTGIVYAGQDYVERVEAGDAPRNLVQLLAMGTLLVGATAELEADARSGLVVPLPEVLKSERYEDMDTSGYNRLDVGEWGMDDYVDYGRWLDGLTRDPGKAKTGLSREIIKRAFYIGIGPSVGRIGHRQRFGNTTHFYEACNVLPNRGLYRYDDWTGQQLADYAEGVFLDLKSQAESRGENISGHKLKLNAEIERRAKLGLGPALWIYKRNEGGGVMRFMAMNGYADPKSMKPKDYVDLGVKIMRANGGRLPTASTLDFLSRSRRAPSAHDVWTHFTWDDYVAQIQAAYKEEGIGRKFVTIKQEPEDGALPGYVIKVKPTMEVTPSRAKWQVVSVLLPDLDDSQQQLITLSEDAANFVAAIRLHSHGTFSSANIERTAKELNVYEDIWSKPEDNTTYMDYLRVPAALLGYGRSGAYLASVKKGSV